MPRISQNVQRRAYNIRQVAREEEIDLTYAPEKFRDNYGHTPLKHVWQDFSLARLDNPSNFEAD